MTAIENTSHNDHMTLSLALSYSSREEIVNVVKQIADLTSAFSIIQIKQQVLDKPLSQELNI